MRRLIGFRSLWFVGTMLCSLVLQSCPSMLFAQDASSSDGQPTRALQLAIDDGNLDRAISEVRKLPPKERVRWIDPILSLKDRASSNGASGESRTDLGNGRNGVEGGLGATGLDDGGGSGGAAQANFGPLIQLIMSVVDGNWESDGGSDTITPFASGVWIDAKGMVHPRAMEGWKAVELARSSDTSPVIVLPKEGMLPASSTLRWISLNQLEKRLQERLQDSQIATASMEWVGGLARIQYVAYHEETHEWMLGGPAGNFAVNAMGDIVHAELGTPPVLLEDLVNVAGHVLAGKGVLGCSIDPKPDRLVATQAFISNASNLRRLVEQPKRFTEQLLEKIGDQEISVMGLDDDSPTALALIAADQHLKKIGLGLERGPKGLLDYIQHSERLGTNMNQAMVRWWFAIQSNNIGVDPSGNVFSIPSDSVAVLSEKEFLDASGKRAADNLRDSAADAFAKDFTRRFDEVQKLYPVYGRLHHIVDLTIAFELIRRESEKGKPCRLDGLTDPKLQTHLSFVPKWSSSVGTHRVVTKGSTKTTVAMVSGGVVLDPKLAVGKAKSSSEALPSLKSIHPTDRYNHHHDWMYEGQ